MSEPRSWVCRQAHLPIVIKFRQDGRFDGEFPALPGVTAEGASYDEAVLNVAKAVQERLEANGV